jgi:hypothetical protein
MNLINLVSTIQKGYYPLLDSERYKGVSMFSDEPGSGKALEERRDEVRISREAVKNKIMDTLPGRLSDVEEQLKNGRLYKIESNINGLRWFIRFVCATPLLALIIVFLGVATKNFWNRISYDRQNIIIAAILPFIFGIISTIIYQKIIKPSSKHSSKEPK